MPVQLSEVILETQSDLAFVFVAIVILFDTNSFAPEKQALAPLKIIMFEVVLTEFLILVLFEYLLEIIFLLFYSFHILYINLIRGKFSNILNVCTVVTRLVKVIGL